MFFSQTAVSNRLALPHNLGEEVSHASMREGMGTLIPYTPNTVTTIRTLPKGDSSNVWCDHHKHIT